MKDVIEFEPGLHLIDDCVCFMIGNMREVHSYNIRNDKMRVMWSVLHKGITYNTTETVDNYSEFMKHENLAAKRAEIIHDFIEKGIKGNNFQTHQEYLNSLCYYSSDDTEEEIVAIIAAQRAKNAANMDKKEVMDAF